jgi:hypothetical protein
MQDVQADHLARLAILGYAGIGLAVEEVVSLTLGQFLDLEEITALTKQKTAASLLSHGEAAVLFLASCK